MKKKILIVGAGITANEICKKLKKKFHISTCGVNRHDLAVKNSNKHYFLNYKNKTELLKFCKKKNFNYIIPDGNDISYLSSSYLADKLKFSGFDNYITAKNILSKINFNRICKKHKIPIPNFSLKKNFSLDNIKLPLIFRPDYTESGKGIFKIENKNDLLKLKKSKTKKFIISEFIRGSLHSCTMMINKKNKKFVFVDEFCIENPFVVDFSNSPSLISKHLKIKVKKNLIKLSKIFRLKSGILHVQFIIKKNKIYIIEATRRCPGDYFGSFIKKSYNFDYYLFYSKSFLSDPFKLQIKANKNLIYRKTLKKIDDYVNYKKHKDKNLYLSYRNLNKKKYGVLIF